MVPRGYVLAQLAKLDKSKVSKNENCRVLKKMVWLYDMALVNMALQFLEIF